MANETIVQAKMRAVACVPEKIVAKIPADALSNVINALTYAYLGGMSEGLAHAKKDMSDEVQK